MKPLQMATAAFQDFLTTPLQARLARHLTTSPQNRVVELFRGAARDVPAYREFLTSQGIDSADVKTYADFQTLPLTTKQNYMLAYPLPAPPARPVNRYSGPVRACTSWTSPPVSNTSSTAVSTRIRARPWS
jgi:phenylacetate-coenzyme A ligase PaaK-like adenylate-forming protein